MSPQPASDEGQAGASGRAEASGSIEAGGRADKAPLSKRKDQPWLKRWAPEKTVQPGARLYGMLELGAMFGLLFPSRAHELFDPDLDLPLQGFRPLQPAAFELGGRLGYYPMRFFGVEAEGAWMPSRTRDTSASVNLWTARAHGVLQLGLWSVTPFVLVGGGVLGVSSPREALGSNIDQAFHVGVGAKVYINRWMQARLDLRNTLHPRQGLGTGATSSPEILLGLSFTLGRKRDRDVPVETPKPKLVLSDRDGDGFFDEDDACPDEPGVAPDGCPVGDRDGDGFPDDEDACPDEPGVEPDGCPDLDADGDGIPIPQDLCPDEPETFNGFEDEDGCPDTLPEEVTRFEGTLEGVFFDVGKATLRPQSRTKLDEAVDVLKRHEAIQVEISGHTDSTGSRELNMELSRSRADAVKTYLVEHGVPSERIRTRGAGPDEPIDSNASRDGRSRNRRIEFRVLEWVAP
jgi:OmpA-OmpF porin, OOP family